IVSQNWSFIIIGSVSVVYWRSSNIIVSKFLTLRDVAHFEISFRMFSIAQILPLVVAVSLFPSLVKWYKDGNLTKFISHYHNVLSLSLNLVCGLVILHFVPSLTVINISIFGSFAIFHICQDYVLIKKKICTVGHALKFYIQSVVLVGGFLLLHNKMPAYISFP